MNSVESGIVEIVDAEVSEPYWTTTVKVENSNFLL